jgi:hypothetical protein
MSMKLEVCSEKNWSAVWGKILQACFLKIGGVFSEKLEAWFEKNGISTFRKIDDPICSYIQAYMDDHTYDQSFEKTGMLAL